MTPAEPSSQPITIKRGQLAETLRAWAAEDQPFDEWWAEFARETARRARYALACNRDGEGWPGWSSREMVAVAIVLDDAEAMRAEGCYGPESAMRFVADGNFDPPADMGAYFARIRADIA